MASTSNAGSVSANAKDSPAPLAKMAHTAVSLRNSSKGRTTTAVANANGNWDEHKARSVDNWASGLQPEAADEIDDRERDRRTMRAGIARLSGSFSASTGELDRGYTGQRGRGRGDANGADHPNLHLWSSTTSNTRYGKPTQAASVGGGYTNTQANGTSALGSNPPPLGLPNTIPSRFTTSLSASSQRRDISKASSTRSTRSSVPVLVVPYTPPPPPPGPSTFSSPPSAAGSHRSRFSFSLFTTPILPLPKNLYKMRSSGPPPSLPPVAEFGIENIMDFVKRDSAGADEDRGVQGDLERIAEICARSRLSLANQYERHMPPHGEGWAPGQIGEGPMEGRREPRRRKGRSRAFETLETIYASSSSGRSSKDGKGRKKSAMELAKEVRERKVKEECTAEDPEAEEAQGHEADHERSVIGEERDKHVRREGLIVGSRHTQPGRDGKRRKRLAAVVIDTASTNGSAGSSRRLTSRPLKPRTSNIEMGVSTMVEAIAVHEQLHNTEVVSEHRPHIPIAEIEVPIPTLPALHDERKHSQQPSQSVLGSFSTWLPWLSQPRASVAQVPLDVQTETYFEVLPSAEGSLKRLLEGRGKSIDVRQRREAG